VLILQLGKITAIFSYMPLIYQHQINQTSQLGVWHIAEGEPFFLQKVPLQRSITHPHKRLQHLAGRYLLTELVPDFPLDLIRVAYTRKPFLANEAWHFSLSHCGDYAAAIVSPAQRVGVDVELVSEKVARVRHKFLTEAELAMLHDEFGMLNAREPLTVDRESLAEGRVPSTYHYQLSTINYQLLTVCWSIKEALFKWKGSGEMDFRRHLRIEQLHIKDNEGVAQCRILKDGDIDLKVYCLLFGGVCLSWVCS
jgi:phosphopantetheinyl transferase